MWGNPSVRRHQTVEPLDTTRGPDVRTSAQLSKNTHPGRLLVLQHLDHGVGPRCRKRC